MGWMDESYVNVKELKHCHKINSYALFRVNEN